MGLTTYERTLATPLKLNTILTRNGYTDVSGSSFLGQIVTALKDAFAHDFNAIYRIADNTDIARASGEYLDRFGSLYNEPREGISFAQDLSLANVELYLTPDVTAGAITSDGAGLPIPAGSIIRDNQNKYIFQTIDDTVIRANRSSAFVRVIATSPGELFVPAGSLTVVDVRLSEFASVMPSALTTYSLQARNTYAISGGSAPADDETFKYVLSEKSKSLGLYNEHRIHTLMDIDDIVNIIIQEYPGGANVYVDTRTITVLDAVVETARMALRRNWARGLTVNVFSPLVRKGIAEISLYLTNKDNLGEITQNVKTYICEYVADTVMGQVVNMSEVMTSVAGLHEYIVSATLRRFIYGGREIIGTVIPQHFNERMTISEQDITIIT